MLCVSWLKGLWSDELSALWKTVLEEKLKLFMNFKHLKAFLIEIFFFQSNKFKAF